ncbi:MAG: polysaccharide deacetylase family protein [Chthonomonadaceae bacterium]|nr:polysaccharide deacetylase family protein [Chthonomonadaceae bacterium]
MIRAILLALIVFAAGWGCVVGNASTTTYKPPTRNEALSQDEALRTYLPVDDQPEASPHVVKPIAPKTEALTSTIPEKSTKVEEPAIPVKLVRGSNKTKKIALTFDDGPHKGFTERLLAILKELDVKSTFFLIGRNVEASPELAKQAFDAGVELANHTYTHTRLSELTDLEVKYEIERGADEIAKATGYRPKYYRPPGGEYDSRVEKITKELGMTMVLWTADAGDFTTLAGNPKTSAIVSKVLRYAGPGGIIIMHDPMPSSLEALPLIVTTLRTMGYEFVTVSELAREPGAVTTGGPRIRPSAKSTVQSLVQSGRYPKGNLYEEYNADQEQRTEGQEAPKGTADQRVDQNSQVRKGTKVKGTDRQSG